MKTARGGRESLSKKPFGLDSDSAAELNRQLAEVFEENRIYRIDPLLGAETIRNLLLFRFANIIFNQAWDNRCIDQVRITAADSLGIENRGAYFEQAGVLRDLFQPHLLQILALFAMEPPGKFGCRRCLE